MLEGASPVLATHIKGNHSWTVFRSPMIPPVSLQMMVAVQSAFLKLGLEREGKE